MHLGRLFRGQTPSSQTTVKQPIPQVTADDVQRIVRRDFSADEYASVMAILSEYGTEKWHRERARVQLAALKWANGSVRRLRTSVGSAKCDYRDVLAGAEYPAYSKIGFRIRELPAEDRDRVIDGDRRQYDEWLKK